MYRSPTFLLLRKERRKPLVSFEGTNKPAESFKRKGREKMSIFVFRIDSVEFDENTF